MVSLIIYEKNVKNVTCLCIYAPLSLNKIHCLSNWPLIHLFILCYFITKVISRYFTKTSNLYTETHIQFNSVTQIQS